MSEDKKTVNEKVKDSIAKAKTHLIENEGMTEADIIERWESDAVWVL